MSGIKSKKRKGTIKSMRKLLRYLKHYKKESIIGPLFKLLEACFELIVPLVMANIIDIGIKNQDMPYIWKMGASNSTNGDKRIEGTTLNA